MKSRNGTYINLVLIILSAFLLLSSCGLGDWNYKLSNGYEIWRVNSQKIILVKTDDDITGETVIDSYITSFCYNERYVGIKRIPIDDDVENFNFEKIDIEKATQYYYLFDTSNEIVYGPYDSSEYEKKISSFEIEKMCDWINTVPKPEKAE